MPAVVVGVGNRLRADDGIGPLVLDALAARRDGGDAALVGAVLVESDGEPTRLIEAWAGAELAVVVDACVSGAPAGTVRAVVVTGDDPRELPPGPAPASSHATGVADAVSLAAALGRLPARLVVVAVEAGDLSLGAPPTPAVLAGVGPVADVVCAELRSAGALGR